VTVNIRSDIKATVTDENGYYRFENMEPGAHVVWIDPQTLPEPYRPLDDQPILKIVVYPGGAAATPSRTLSSSKPGFTKKPS
jgi:hypothetical protein